MPGRAAPDRLTLAAFAGAVLIGGSDFVAVELSNAELTPMYGAAARFTAAAALFFVLTWSLSLRLPRGRQCSAARSMARSGSEWPTACCTMPCSKSASA
ncbi:MAG: hypothetical protein M3400_04855 [Actinomycetota bacterium]|nr:hypothetical protein [Actinomycetota bacterium]